MAEIKVAGVMRSGAFSPNHIGNDAIIFNLVADQLRKRGCEINVYSEEQFAAAEINAHAILAMCREPRNIQRIQHLEDEGCIVVNSGYGIENCTRERMSRLLMGAGLPYPETFIVDTDEVVKDRLIKAGITRCWVKRADIHTRHHEDVAFARHPEEAQEIIQEFFLRGIKRAIISRNIEGELVKFYGVVGSSFFHWLTPSNDDPRLAFTESTHRLAKVDPEILKRLSERAAETLDIKVYGGDCIITPDGRYVIININDWPSFAPCRSQAASAIARMFYSHVKKSLSSRGAQLN